LWTSFRWSTSSAKQVNGFQAIDLFATQIQDTAFMIKTQNLPHVEASAGFGFGLAR
jgi:hypothetical protein